jgi:DNA-binding NarL/FixJ family response regulator
MMIESVTADVAGTQVYLIGQVRGSMDAVADWLRQYKVEPTIFPDAQSAIVGGRPHVVAYVKSDGQDELEMMRGHFHTARFLVIGTITSEEDLLASFGRGIHGWVMHWEPVDMIASAIVVLCRGGSALSIPVLEILQRRADVSGVRGLGSAAMRGLTRRQVEILELVSRGYTDRDIADLLTLSTRTVQRHVQDVLQKLGVHTREAAVETVIGGSPRPVRQHLAGTTSTRGGLYPGD